MVEIEESWMQKIRDIAPVIEKTEYEVFRCDAEVKKLHATLKMKSLSRWHENIFCSRNVG